MKLKTLASMILAGGLAATALISLADSDRGREWGERGEYMERSEYGERRGEYKRKSEYGSGPIENAQYKDECGACHFAYQPDFLPERSWKRLMAQLDDHFGENAELDDASRQALTDYLINNAGDRTSHYRSKKMVRSIKRGDTPMRITDTPYFKREHREVSKQVLSHEQIGSFSNCSACHRAAEQGSFEEGDINIPGRGRWED